MSVNDKADQSAVANEKPMRVRIYAIGIIVSEPQFNWADEHYAGYEYIEELIEPAKSEGVSND